MFYVQKGNYENRKVIDLEHMFWYTEPNRLRGYCMQKWGACPQGRVLTVQYSRHTLGGGQDGQLLALDGGGYSAAATAERGRCSPTHDAGRAAEQAVWDECGAFRLGDFAAHRG